MANLHKKIARRWKPKIDERNGWVKRNGRGSRNNNNDDGTNDWLSHKNATPHKFANNENGKKKQHTHTNTQTDTPTHSHGYSALPSKGRVVNKVPNHEAYKMKIHPQKKLPRIFPLFFVFLFMGGRQKRNTQNALWTLRVCVCVCVQGCVWVVAWLLVSLSLCLQNNQKRTSRRRRQSHLPLATCHQPLLQHRWSVEHMACACRDTSRCWCR